MQGHGKAILENTLSVVRLVYSEGKSSIRKTSLVRSPQRHVLSGQLADHPVVIGMTADPNPMDSLLNIKPQRPVVSTDAH